jgi:hypothetical protein
MNEKDATRFVNLAAENGKEWMSIDPGVDWEKMYDQRFTGRLWTSREGNHN